MAALRTEIGTLRGETQRAQQRFASWRAEAATERDGLHAELAALRDRVQAQQALVAALREGAAAALPPPRDALVQRVAELTQRLKKAQPREPPVPEATAPVPELPPLVVDMPTLAPESLCDLRVLCVGGCSFAPELLAACAMPVPAR